MKPNPTQPILATLIAGIMLAMISVMSLQAQPYEYDYKYDGTSGAAGNRTELVVSPLFCLIPCDCPPEKNDWLVVSTSMDGALCPDQCKVDLQLKIPADNYCYTKYQLIQEDFDGTTTTISKNTGMQNFTGSSSLDYDACLPSGITRTIKITLYDNNLIACQIEQTITCNLDCCDYINVQFNPYDDGLGNCCWIPDITTDESICDFTGKVITVDVYKAGVLQTPGTPNGEICFGTALSTDITYKIKIDGVECSEERAVTLTCDDCSLISIVFDPPTVGDECCHEFSVNVDPTLANIMRYISIFKTSELPANDIDKVNRSHPDIVYYNIINWMSKGEICNYSLNPIDYVAVIYDKYGNILCEKTFNIQGCQCECPQDLNKIIDVDMFNGPGSNCPDQMCSVEISLKDKVDLSCYDRFEMTQTFKGDGNADITTPLTDMSDFDATFAGGICIGPDEEITIELKLYQNGDPVPCILTKTYTCDLRKVDLDADELCKPDCPESDWVGVGGGEDPWNITYEIPGTTCEIKVVFYSREACGYQDIQIIDYDLVSTDSNATDCSQLYTDSEIYSMTVAAIAGENPMGFEPVLAGDDVNNKICDSFWRATQSSCWIEWIIYTDNSGYGNADGSWSPPNSLWKIHVKREPCQADCCMRKFQVCRWKDSIGVEKVSITDLGMMGTADDCTTISIDNLFNIGGVTVPCEYTCDLLSDIESVINAKQSIESGDNFVDPNALYIELNVTQFGQTLNLKVNNTNADKMRVYIIDINGKILIDTFYELKGGSDLQYSLDMSELITGTYIYSIEIDGKFLSSDNVLIVK